MTPVPYAEPPPAGRSPVLTLGPYALRAYRGAPPPEPVTKEQRAVQVEVPAKKPPAIARQNSLRGKERKPNGCDHSQFTAWAHGGGKVKCAGCRRSYWPDGPIVPIYKPRERAA